MATRNTYFSSVRLTRNAGQEMENLCQVRGFRLDVLEKRTAKLSLFIFFFSSESSCVEQWQRVRQKLLLSELSLANESGQREQHARRHARPSKPGVSRNAKAGC